MVYNQPEHNAFCEVTEKLDWPAYTVFPEGIDTNPRGAVKAPAVTWIFSLGPRDKVRSLLGSQKCHSSHGKHLPTHLFAYEVAAEHLLAEPETKFEDNSRLFWDLIQYIYTYFIPAVCCNSRRSVVVQSLSMS